MTDKQIIVNVAPIEKNINVTFAQGIHKVQADYQQSDTSAADYIKNKPPETVAGDGIVIDNGVVSIDTESELWSEKQDALTPGAGIDIDNGEISVDIDDVITAGDGIVMDNGEISIDTSEAESGYILYAIEVTENGETKTIVRWGTPPTGDYVDLFNKPSINGVTLLGNKTTADLLIPTYSVMTGATVSDPGESGLVPAPLAGENEKFLRGDGTWAVVETTDTKYTAGANISIDANDNNKISVSSGESGANAFLRSDGNGGASWSNSLVRSVNGVVGDVIMFPKVGNGANSLLFTAYINKVDTSGEFSETHGRNTKATGAYAMAFGYGTSALRDHAISYGENTVANNYYSEAHGTNTSAYGVASVAFGSDTTASDNYAAAFGGGTTASGSNSFAIGDRTTAYGTASFAGGNQSRATGPISFAFGYASEARGDYSEALGQEALASGIRSFAAGFRPKATGSNSVAIGNQAEATGTRATALGYDVDAIGSYSLATGSQSRAEGNYSTAMGNLTIASGNWSLATGCLTRATQAYSTIVGCNGTTPTDALFTVANGINAASTAFNIYQNGDIEAGANWTPTVDNHLATKKYVDDHSGGGTPDWSDITNKPSTFPPSAHTHTYSDITNPPTIPVAGQIASGDTGYATGGAVYSALGALGATIQHDAGGYYIETGV